MSEGGGGGVREGGREGKGRWSETGREGREREMEGGRLRSTGATAVVSRLSRVLPATNISSFLITLHSTTTTACHKGAFAPTVM